MSNKSCTSNSTEGLSNVAGLSKGCHHVNEEYSSMLAELLAGRDAAKNSTPRNPVARPANKSTSK